MVCQHRSCQRNGSEAVYAAFQDAKAAKNPTFFVSKSDCMGQCSSGPTVKILPDETWYCRVKPEHIPQIVEQHLGQDTPVKSLLHPRFHPQFVVYGTDSHADEQSPEAQAKTQVPEALSSEPLSPQSPSSYSKPDSFNTSSET